MPAPIFAGADRALVRLHSGEYVAVDTNSIDALPYLTRWPIEDAATFVYRCFLKPTSVVLDIGANFGLYTAIAGTIVRDRGRVFAFEGNPHTFDLLLRTLHANRLFDNPSVTPVNVLVSDKCGRGTLYYSPKGLGGATMTDIGEHFIGALAKLGAEVKTVENAMTTIDAVLPADMAVDLVKIDIEGHEPFAIRGMVQTIARSPGVRLIIEFNDGFLKYTVPAPQFLREIEELGLGICKIGRHGHLERVLPGEPPKGHFELLLTRTPEEDMKTIEAQRRRLVPQIKRWVRRVAADLQRAWERL